MKKTGVDKNILDVRRIMEKFHGKAAADDIFRDIENVEYGGFEEPLPDVVGYKQHATECTSDAMQEILMFADGIREFTQPIIYNITPQQIALRSKLALKYVDWDRYTQYFEFVQKRFRSHYDVINYLRTHKIKPRKFQTNYNKVCALNPLFYRKRAHSAEAGILALKKLKREREYTATGFPTDEIYGTFAAILNWLHIPFKVMKLAHSKLDTAAGYTVNVKTGFVKPDKSIYWKTTLTHQTAFLKLNAKWHFYDNEKGFLHIDDGLIAELLDPKSQIYIARYRDTYFVKGQMNPTHIWKNGRWDPDVSVIADIGDPDDIYGNQYKINTRLMRINHKHIYGICSTINNKMDKTPYNYNNCKFTGGRAATSGQAIATMKDIIGCIHANTHSNSSVFEDLYHYMYENLDHLATEPELYESLASTLDTIVFRPACSPMIHYWVFQIKFKIKGTPRNEYEWFEVPALKQIDIRVEGKETPPEVREAMLKAEEEREKDKALMEKGIDKQKVEKPKLPPCPPDQVRDPKTKLCRERITRKSKNGAPKKREKLTPCPPGQKRDPTTKKCKARLERLTPCPPGQKRDTKTRKCVDLKKIKLHE